MSTIVPPTFNICANCAYWTGNRKIDGFFKRVEIDDLGKPGQCINIKSCYKCWMPYGATCTHFEKLQVLK